MHWKNFLYFSLAEKIAVLILVVIIMLSFGLNVLLSKRSNSPISISQNDSLIVAFQRLNDGLVDKKAKPKNYEYKYDTNPKGNISRHKISEPNESLQNNNYSEYPRYTKQEKFTEAGSISLNETDTTQWKMVPGIGSSFSARIVKYRDKLGGYISIDQLKEVYEVTDDVFAVIAPFIHKNDIDRNNCVKLNINKLEFKEILAHPYIDFEQTKAIVNLRKRTGKISSLSQLAMLDEFKSEDIERITPYIDF